MKAANVRLGELRNDHEMLAAMDAIENDRQNYNGNWMRGGPDIELKAGAKKKLDAIQKKLWAMYPDEG